MEATQSDAVILQERAYLETYFHCLSKFAHDKAKEIVEREREATKIRASLLWSSTLHLLSTLAVSEKEFFSLVYLSPNLGSRLLGRKDALRTTYGCLLTELRKIENTHKVIASKTGGDKENLEELICHLSGQLQHYIVARINTIAFYEQMLAASQKCHISITELLRTITGIIQTCEMKLQHPVLDSLKLTFSQECETVLLLLQAHSCIQRVEFLRALRHLYDAHVKLGAWGNTIGSKEVKKLGFVSSSSRSWVPELYEWLVKYKGVLVSKFSLVFYDVLSRQGPPSEIRAILSKTYTDFYGRLVAFHKKTDAYSVCLMLNVSELGVPYRGFGYHKTQEYTETTETHPGLENFPFIFSHPTERPEKHWPTLVALLTFKSQDLISDRLVYSYDEKFQSTYFMVRIDPAVMLIVIFETKRLERDTYITNFLLTLASELRCSKIFAGLKPGSK